MLTINTILNKDNFSYDILPLVHSFYPDAEVKMMVVENPKGNKELVNELSKRFTKATLSAQNTSKKSAVVNIFIDFISNELSEEISICSDNLLLYEKFGEELSAACGNGAGFENEAAESLLDEAGDGFFFEASAGFENENFRKSSVSVDFSNRKDTKNELKKLVYYFFSDITGKELPWGTLSGIRPAKIVSDYLKTNMSMNAIYEEMKEVYLISDEKFDLAAEVALNEERMLKDIDSSILFDEADKTGGNKGYSLYVSIPFCPSICGYCTFSSTEIGGDSIISGKTVKNTDLLEEYLKALHKEIEEMGEFLKDRVLTTVYIGGGTPTTLSENQLDELIAKLKLSFDFSTVKEFTVECGRPDTITFEKLKVLKNHKVDRISINPQTMNQKTLDLIGRKHTVEQAEETFLLARSCGFENINMDFIMGLPGETEEDVKNSMNRMLMLAPDSLTVHSLAVKRAAKFNTDKDEFEKLESTNNQEIMDIAADTAKFLEMEAYYMYRQKNMAGNMENVGYAVSGKECLYNVLMMEDKQWIVALGAGGISKALFTEGKVKRAPNVKEIPVYIERIEEMIDRKKALW